MSNNINLRKGLNVPLAGAAVRTVRKTILPDVVAIRPSDFRDLTPKLLVKEGDKVLAGSPVLADKMSQNILFTSPVSGTVSGVVRGDKRKLLAVLIKTDEVQEYVDFGIRKVDELDAEAVKEALLSSGLWTALVQRPYGIVANPELRPRAIYVSAFNTAPLAADNEFVLADEFDNIQTAVLALAKLTDGGVHVSFNAEIKSRFEALKGITAHHFSGKHPAGNVGVQINNIRPICKGETVWTVSMQMLAAIGKLFNSGRYDVSRKVAITGPMALETAYVKTVPGMPMSAIQSFYGNDAEEIRFVSGDALSGANVGAEGYLRFQDNQVTLLKEGNEYEAFGWANPLRFKQFSSSHTYFHWLLKLLCPKKEYALDTNLHGGERAFVVSDVYGKVLPMSIFPVYLVKACLAGDIDKMEKFGIYEVLEEDLALCEYVCPSKIDIQAIIAKGIDTMIKEMA